MAEMAPYRPCCKVTPPSSHSKDKIALRENSAEVVVCKRQALFVCKWKGESHYMMHLLSQNAKTKRGERVKKKKKKQSM
jgi:hypothetical protein